MPDDVVARLEALQKVEEVTEETQVEKNLPKMELPIWSMASRSMKSFCIRQFCNNMKSSVSMEYCMI